MKKLRDTICFCLLSILYLSVIPDFCSVQAVEPGPTPPQQPLQGPGGSDYSHAGVRQTNCGSGVNEFWIFEPAEPTPASAPLIVFNHGWGALFPYFYQAWVDHLARRGNIVVYPRYQLTLNIGVRNATQNAIAAVQQALEVLQEGHVKPELDHFAIVGHSLGGGITAEMAVLAEANHLPIPKAVMPVQPYLRSDTMINDFHGLPASILLLAVVGEDDGIAGDASAKVIFTTSDQIPISQKNYIVQRTDRYGDPDLVADHLAPLCMPDTSFVNAMDYYSTWKLFDGLTDYAFYGTNRQYCLGDTPEQRFMGLWSDGTPVQELLVTDSP
jgi:dienelactone hydrolase